MKMKTKTKTKKNGFTLIELLLVITILLILAAVIIPRFAREKTELEPKIDITTVSVNQPELGIESARFYLVKGPWVKEHWDYNQPVQFKDIKDDKILDQVALVNMKDFFEGLNPRTGYPADIVFDLNSPDQD